MEENRQLNQSCREGHVTLPRTACAPVQGEGFNIKKSVFVTGTVLQIQTAVDVPMEEEYNTRKTAIVTGICKPTTKDDHANTGEQ